MYYYQHNIGDYKADTAHLTLLEHGCYRQLLDWYYKDESPLPRETEVVFRRLSARTEEDKLAIQLVLNDFFELGENGYSHKRCDAEISTYQQQAERARQNGKLGGRPKKTEVVILANPDVTQTKANQEPITNNHKPITINQETKEKNKNTVAPLVLPQWLSPEDWQRFVDYRKKSSGKKFTAEAEKLNLTALAKLVKDGQDPIAVIDQSIAKGWSGLFAVKDQSFGNRGTSMDQTLADLQMWAAEGSSNG